MVFKAVVLAREAQRRSNLSYRLASHSANAGKIASLCEKQKLAAMTSRVFLDNDIEEMPDAPGGIVKPSNSFKPH